MALEPIFDLVGTLEAIEARLPQGRLVAKALLSLGAVCAGWFMVRFLATELVWPMGQIMVRVFSGRIGLPLKLLLPWALAVVLAGAISFGLERWVRSIQSNISAHLTELNRTLDRYQLIFWKPLDGSEKKQLIDELAALGRHSILIVAVETTDCLELARDIRECFEAAKWQMFLSPRTVGQRRETSSGFLLWFKEGADVFNKKVFNALLGATNGPIRSLTHGRPDAPDVQIVLGPRRVSND